MPFKSVINVRVKDFEYKNKSELKIYLNSSFKRNQKFILLSKQIINFISLHQDSIRRKKIS